MLAAVSLTGALEIVTTTPWVPFTLKPVASPSGLTKNKGDDSSSGGGTGWNLHESSLKIRATR